MERTLRFAVFGAGFWARFQLAAWRELPGARCVAVGNRTRAKAEALAAEFGVPAVYDQPEALLAAERPDFVDIIAGVEAHRPLVELAAARHIPVICQKPMGPTLADAEAMVAACRRAQSAFFVHENWRWQAPLRAVHAELSSGRIGRVFRARVDYVNSFPVFENQPFLKELEQFILTDMGSHILDVARFLFGEPEQVYCQTARVHPDIRGEDVATVVARHAGDTTVTCNLSYASPVEHDRFPETRVLVEGSEGSVELAPDFWLRVTTRAGTVSRRCPPPFYAWADPRYAVVHASIVDCQRHLLAALRGEGTAETTGEDNLRTLRAVFAAYASVRKGQAVRLIAPVG